MADRQVHLVEEVDCPHCDRGPHRVDLVATVNGGRLVFRGPDERSAPFELDIPCPVTNEPVAVRVHVPVLHAEEVTDVRVRDPRDRYPNPRNDPPGEPPDDSSAVGRDAAGKLLAAGTAAVAAYLALLGYVAGESLAGWRLTLGVLPAVGFLTVTVLSAVALRPLLARVYDRQQAELFLERVLRRQSRLLTVAVTVLVGSTATAVAALLVLLARPS